MNPGCACDSCKNDQATFWPPALTPHNGLYWTFMWHCARGCGWSDWYDHGDELI